MALQKQYLIKMFDPDGATFIKNIPQGDGGLKNIPTFKARINGGFSECVLDFDLPWDNFGEGGQIDFINIGEVWVTDASNPLGRRVYRGFVSKYEPYIDGTQEGVKVTLLGLVALLSRSYYKSGSTFAVTHSAQDPEAIAKAIIDHFNTIFGGSLINYAGGSTQTVGTAVTVTFTDQRWIEAMTKTISLAGTDWWWFVDQDGLFQFKAKPGAYTHTFTVGKDIDSINVQKTSETVINDIQVRGASGGTADVSDATSQTTYGTGSPATGKYSNIISDSSLGDSNAMNQAGNKSLGDNKDATVSSSLVVNNKYDIESVHIGQTCQLANYNHSNNFFSNNMLIVAIEYFGDSIKIDVEKETFNVGAALAGLITSTTSSSSSGGGSSGGSTPGFYDKEVPSGSIDGINTAFTIAHTPVTGSEYVYLNGILQNATGIDYTISGANITFVTAPPSGATLLVSYRTSNGSVNFVDREVPSGTIDGSNATFTTAHTPTTGSEHIWLDGILQNGSGADYTMTGTSIVFVSPPPSGATILVSYRY